MSKQKSPLPTVTDKSSFRAWCAAMYMNSHHVAALLSVSRSNVYKYLSDDSPVDLRGPVMLLCQLVNEKTPEERLVFFQSRLGGVLADQPWPASDPIEV